MEKTRTCTLCVIILTSFLLTCCTGRDEKLLPDALLPNVSHTFPVDIGAVNHIVQGRISANARRGTLVPSNVVLEGDTDTDMQVHLRVEVRDSVYTRPHVYDPRIKVNTSDPSNPQFKHPVIHFTDGELPYGMELVVLHTNAFSVDKDRFIVVNDFDSLGETTRIHFHVILKDKLAETHYVSNHLPFVVEIEHPQNKPNPNAALFAGVLILTIMAISLIIPFVVRAKRRTKAGKPVCGCGSADDSSSDSGSTGSAPDYVKHRTMGGKDNLAMILDNGRLMQQRPSVDQHTTIQNHMLRSTSNMKFQPHYLDPHYQDIYDRPDFNYDPQGYGPAQYSNGYNYNAGNAPPFARGYGINSNRSSASSFYNYPVNFNPANVMNNKRKYVKHSNGNGGKHETANGDAYTAMNGRVNRDEERNSSSSCGLPSKAEAVASESPRATLTRGMTIATSQDEIEAVAADHTVERVTENNDDTSAVREEARL